MMVMVPVMEALKAHLRFKGSVQTAGSQPRLRFCGQIHAKQYLEIREKLHIDALRRVSYSFA